MNDGATTAGTTLKSSSSAGKPCEFVQALVLSELFDGPASTLRGKDSSLTSVVSASGQRFAVGSRAIDSYARTVIGGSRRRYIHNSRALARIGPLNDVGRTCDDIHGPPGKRLTTLPRSTDCASMPLAYGAPLSSR
jgi:hypothetical protein